MSDAEEASMLIVFQTQNYLDVILACVATYSWALDLGRELELIWARQNSIVFKMFYGVLRYGSLIINLSALPGAHATLSTCSALIVLNNLLLRTTIFLFLNVMMGMRIWALYGRSKRVLLVLGSCFAVVQVANVGLTFMAMLPLNVSVVHTPTGGAWCSYAVSNRQAWYQMTAFISLVAYECLLLILFVVSFVRSFKEQRQGIAAMMDTFMGLIVRDNVIYFLLAFLGLTLSACSVFTVSIQSLAFNVGFNTVAADLGSGLQLTILGPLMILSILEYDAVREHGGTSHYTETGTMRFAAAASPDGYEDDPLELYQKCHHECF